MANFPAIYPFVNYFMSWAPPSPEKLKSKQAKKKVFRCCPPPPPLRIPGHAPGHSFSS